MTDQTKKCSDCKELKPATLEYFFRDKARKHGVGSYCKACSRIRSRAHYESNKQKVIERSTKWNKDNKDKRNERFKERYHNEPGFKEKAKIRNKKAIEKYKPRRNAIECERRKSNPSCALRQSTSSAIYYALKKQGGSKNDHSCWEYLPYTSKQLKEHLEAQFDEHMTWDNWGRFHPTEYRWQIDHIIPQSKLLYESLEDENFLKCWALENLQPLETVANMKKSNKII